jgi:hypothetical protein
LKDVQQSGTDQVAYGAFGDVYKGLIRGQEVALKIPRLYTASDVNAMLKVRSWGLPKSVLLTDYRTGVLQRDYNMAPVIPS